MSLLNYTMHTHACVQLVLSVSYRFVQNVFIQIMFIQISCLYRYHVYTDIMFIQISCLYRYHVISENSLPILWLYYGKYFHILLFIIRYGKSLSLSCFSLNLR